MVKLNPDENYNENIPRAYDNANIYHDKGFEVQLVGSKSNRGWWKALEQQSSKKKKDGISKLILLYENVISINLIRQ